MPLKSTVQVSISVLAWVETADNANTEGQVHWNASSRLIVRPERSIQWLQVATNTLVTFTRGVLEANDLETAQLHVRLALQSIDVTEPVPTLRNYPEDSMDKLPLEFISDNKPRRRPMMLMKVSNPEPMVSKIHASPNAAMSSDSSYQIMEKRRQKRSLLQSILDEDEVGECRLRRSARDKALVLRRSELRISASYGNRTSWFTLDENHLVVHRCLGTCTTVAHNTDSRCIRLSPLSDSICVNMPATAPPATPTSGCERTLQADDGSLQFLSSFRPSCSATGFRDRMLLAELESDPDIRMFLRIRDLDATSCECAVLA